MKVKEGPGWCKTKLVVHDGLVQCTDITRNALLISHTTLGRAVMYSLWSVGMETSPMLSRSTVIIGQKSTLY